MATVRPLALMSFVLATFAACSPKDAPADAASESRAPANTQVPTASPVPAGEPTADDFTSYELTMDKMRKWAAVTKGFGTFSGTSADSAAMMTVKIGTDPISESERKIESIAPMKRIFADAGITPREYHMITGAYAMSSMPNSKNLEFVKVHKAELDKLMADINSAGR